MAEDKGEPGTEKMAGDEAMLAVLDEPFVFTQRPTLTVDAFGKELRERHIVSWPEAWQLEAFQRAGSDGMVQVT